MKELGKLFMIVASLFIITLVMSWFLPYGGIISGNVAKIYINGEIVTEKSDYLFGKSYASSSDLIRQVDDAESNPSVKAIIFEINSPGGSAVASYEIANAIKKSNKTTVAVIREVGASGAYWAASATDYIIANEFSVTGSIGVLSSYLEFSKLFDKYGITYERLVSGEYKDIGSPFRPITDEEKKILQEKIDVIHDKFISKIAENRNLSFEYVSRLSTGEFYLGAEALDLGLIDAIGDEDTAKEYLKKRLNTTTITVAEYKSKPSFLEIFGTKLDENFYFMGKGVSSFLEQKEEGIKT